MEGKPVLQATVVEVAILKLQEDSRDVTIANNVCKIYLCRDVETSSLSFFSSPGSPGYFEILLWKTAG